MKGSQDFTNDIARKAKDYNFDELLNVLLNIHAPKDVRERLLEMNFYAKRCMFMESTLDIGMEDAFLTLQELVNALDTVDEINDRGLTVTAV